ncbi:hypothetical protein AB0G15_15800 [Streptosporangium sp. NPDC023825]|uniref:hypothetical protein n=1 Tax=Streptosporangium sp. NPDC023825 TaxID=3154909 RepID=UPI0034263D91
MSVARCITTAALTALTVALTAPAASAALIPPRPAVPGECSLFGAVTVRKGDRTETWTWGPGYQSYLSSESSSRTFTQTM